MEVDAADAKTETGIPKIAQADGCGREGLYIVLTFCPRQGEAGPA